MDLEASCGVLAAVVFGMRPLALLDVGNEMTTLREAAQQALEAWDGGDTEWFKRAYTVINALRAALAEPVQEPVCDKDPRGCYSVRCQLGRMCKHAATPQRQAEPVGRCEDCGMKYCECGERK